MKLRSCLGSLAACLLVMTILSGVVASPADAADAQFPLASPIGLVPPPGLAPSQRFQGFEDQDHDVFVRLVVLPSGAFGEIEKTMTNEALRKQGMTVEKRENLPLPTGKGLLVLARQQADAVRLRKWLLVAPFGGLTALVSFEIPTKAAERYPDSVVREALDRKSVV